MASNGVKFPLLYAKLVMRDVWSVRPTSMFARSVDSLPSLSGSTTTASLSAITVSSVKQTLPTAIFVLHVSSPVTPVPPRLNV